MNDIEEEVKPSTNLDDLFEFLLDLQITKHGRKTVAVGFIQGKSRYEVRDFFEGVELGD